MAHHRVLGLVLCTCIGCVSTHYTSVDVVPMDKRRALRVLEDQYLNAAKRQASFLASCTPATVVTQILTTRPATVRLSNGGDRFSVDTGEIASIGTEACGQKQIFHVICGLNQRYSPSDWSGSGLCDVLPASEAVRAAQRNQRLQQEMDAAVGSTTQNME